MTAARVHERFAEWAERTPSAIAVVDGASTLSYREVDERAERLASGLLARGIGPGKLVGLALPRGADVVVAMIGILKSGAAYVPLDPMYPRDRLDFMIADSGVDTVVASATVADTVLPGRVGVVTVDEATGRDRGASAVAGGARRGAILGDLAYVMYTSGSTGTPKGVMVTHANVARLFDATRHWYGFGASDVWTLFHSYAFDFSVWEMWGALAHGGRLVIVSHELSRSPRLFRKLVSDARVTVLNQTPSAFHQFVEADLQGDGGTLALRYVIFGGEALDFQTLRPWFERHGDQRPQLVNMYGITETTVHVTYRPLSRADVERDGPSLIGVPIPDLRLHLLRPDMTPVAAGELGELFVGGAGVARGYLNRPVLTSERFVADPFGPEQRGVLYKTGDLVRLRADGELEYHGRTDEQVQLRGFRIELGEIQTVLAAHAAVRSAVVILDGEPPEQRLIAYVVAGSDGIRPADVREWSAARLPEHMVPAVVVVLDRLPLTVNGKVDRRALPRPTSTRPSLRQPYAAPRTDLERFLAGIWEEILGLEGVGVDDPFFELGGTSLQAARFVNALASKLDAKIFEITLFTAPTIASYAAFLLEYYRDAVAAHFDIPGESAAARRDAVATDSRVTAEMLDRVRRVIPMREPASADERSRRLAPALFILAPPRSGTTLLRVMLAGHPQLFGAAELLLLGFDTLADRQRAYSGRFALWREGLVRTLMQIHACSADAAAQLVQEAADDGMTTKEFYRRIQARISPRMLVDKSPAYALDATALRKAERDFQDPLYIHLVRHPNAVVESFVENHIDQVLYLDPHRFEARVLAEAVWTLSHRTIIDFLRDVPPQRQHQIRFEDLVADPGAAMRALCSGLGLPFDEQLLRPYDGLEAKMVDGVHPESAPMGDPSFVQHGKIRAEIADRWRDTHRDDLGESTWELAEDLGYRRTPGDQPPVGRQDDRRRRMLAQLRARRVGRRAEVASDGGGDAAGARERRSGDE